MAVTGPKDFFQARQRSLEFDFESEASPPFNTLSTKKLKEIVLKPKTTFKWQSSKEGHLRREDPFNDWMFTRPLALRPIYWEISSDAYTYFKMDYESELNTEIFIVCADSKFWIRSPEVTKEPWVKFNTSRQGMESESWKSWKQKENRNRLPILVGL